MTFRRTGLGKAAESVALPRATGRAEMSYKAAVAFTVPGEPIGKARARVTRQGRTYTPQKTKGAENAIRQLASLHIKEPLVGPLELIVTVHFKPAKSWSRKRANLAIGTPHTQKPDADNVLKLVADALNGIAYADDVQVARMAVTKRWSVEARTEIFIREHPL